MEDRGYLAGEVRRGAYHDSIVLMELQVVLAEMDGVRDAGVVMGTRSNLDLLAATGLLPREAEDGREADLVIGLRADDRAAAERALAAVDGLLARRRTTAETAYRPRRLETALRQLPEARWVLVSVPGRHAVALARRALALDRSVFLYSDNVSLEEEVALKREAAQRGQLVMGPDCGTALIGGAPFGFVNRVRAGPVGLVGPSGTGLQTVASLIHRGGAGVSQILGTGGRDLSEAVGAATTLRALALLAADPRTRSVAVIAKLPAPAVAARVLAAASTLGKPAVVYFQGLEPGDAEQHGGAHLARSLSDAAALCLRETGARHRGSGPRGAAAPTSGPERARPLPDAAERAAGEPPVGRRLLRGLFAGGTLAAEMLLQLRGRVQPLASNLELDGVGALGPAGSGDGHVVLDLGADAYTEGRPHPMIDFDLRLRELAVAAADDRVAVVVLDVVLGDGAHPDPAAVLEAPVREAVGRTEVIALVIGTDEDPQDLDEVSRRLAAAGARVVHDPATAFELALGCLPRPTAPGRRQRSSGVPAAPAARGEWPGPAPGLELLQDVAAVNVGVERFGEALASRGVASVHVDWRPAAGGDPRLVEILRRTGVHVS